MLGAGKALTLRAPEFSVQGRCETQTYKIHSYYQQTGFRIFSGQHPDNLTLNQDLIRTVGVSETLPDVARIIEKKIEHQYFT